MNTEAAPLTPTPSQLPSRALIAVVTACLYVDMLVYGLVVPFLPQVSVEQGASRAAVGLLFGCYALGMFVCAWPMAWVVPRLGPRATMAAGMGGLMLCTAAYLAATSFGGLLAARTLQGVAAAATWTAGPMVLASSSAPAHRGRVMGLALTGSGLGTLCGPPLGGWLFDRGGPALPFVVALGLLALTLVGVLVEVPARIAARQELPVRRLLGQGRVRLVALMIATAAAMPTLLEPLLPLYLQEHFALTPTQIGLAFGACILSYAVAARPAGILADRQGLRAPAVGLLLSALLLPLLVWAGSVVAVVSVLVLLGAASALSLAPTMAAMATAVDEVVVNTKPDYASVYAIYNAAYAVGMWSGPVLGALLVARLGLGAGLSVAAGGLAVCGTIAWRSSKRSAA